MMQPDMRQEMSTERTNSEDIAKVTTELLNHLNEARYSIAQSEFSLKFGHVSDLYRLLDYAKDFLPGFRKSLLEKINFAVSAIFQPIHDELKAEAKADIDSILQESNRTNLESQVKKTTTRSQKLECVLADRKLPNFETFSAAYEYHSSVFSKALLLKIIKTVDGIVQHEIEENFNEKFFAETMADITNNNGGDVLTTKLNNLNQLNVYTRRFLDSKPRCSPINSDQDLVSLEELNRAIGVEFEVIENLVQDKVLNTYDENNAPHCFKERTRAAKYKISEIVQLVVENKIP